MVDAFVVFLKCKKKTNVLGFWLKLPQGTLTKGSKKGKDCNESKEKKSIDADCMR